MRSGKLVLLIIFLPLYSCKLYAQDIDSMLNTCYQIFSKKNVALYDEAEQILKSLPKDSIEISTLHFSLYHANMAYLYLLKYDNRQKSIEHSDSVIAKIQPFLNVPKYRALYIDIMRGIGWAYINEKDIDKAEECFKKIILEGFDNEYDIRKYDTFYALANIYEEKNLPQLAKECHNNCQEFLVKLYIHNHPEYAFYLDNFYSLKQKINHLEKKSQNNTEDYLELLCSLGALLNKVDNGEYVESMLTLFKAQMCAKENNLLKANCLGECYVLLQDIIFKYVSEPLKSELIEQLVETELHYFEDVLTPDIILGRISFLYSVNKQYEKAIVYSNRILNYLESQPNKKSDMLKQTYQALVMDYLSLKTDNANELAFHNLEKLKEIITEKDKDYYDWYLEEKGCILRYLYRIDEAIKCFSYNLKYFKKKYGELSDNYISTLNQLALSHSLSSNEAYKYLQEAKKLIEDSKEVSDATKRGVSINLARYHIANGNKNQALEEIKKAEEIDISVHGELTPVTLELKNEFER